MKVNDPIRSSSATHDLVIDWIATHEDDTPYAATVNGHLWKIRINDFPDEHLFTLLIDGQAEEDFDDWPAAWVRPERARPAGLSALSDDVYLTEFGRSLRALDLSEDVLSELVRSLRALAPDEREAFERAARELEQLQQGLVHEVRQAILDRYKRH